MDIRPIRTEEDYDWAMAQIDELWGAEIGSPEDDRLEVLTILVDAYEEKHYRIPPPDPIDAIEYHMDSQGLTRKDLEQYIGGRGRVSEVLNRRRPLTLRMIRRLEKGLGIPAAILVQEYESSGADEAREPLVEALAARTRPRLSHPRHEEMTSFVFLTASYGADMRAEDMSENGPATKDDFGEVTWHDAACLDGAVLSLCH